MCLTLQTMRVAYNKLIRDRIPEIINEDGHRAVIHVLDKDSYQAALRAKLLEEAQEASSAPPHALAAELADVLEVLRALVAATGMQWGELLALAADKRAKRGGYEERLFLEYVEKGGSL